MLRPVAQALAAADHGPAQRGPFVPMQRPLSRPDPATAAGLERGRCRRLPRTVVRKSLRRVLPSGRKLLEEGSLRRVLGGLLHNPDLWHLNRKSVAWGVSAGLFCAFVPVPGQTLLAAAASILLGCNLPIALCAVMITNPLTMAPLFFVAYKLGAMLWNAPPAAFDFELSVSWLTTELGTIWKPFLLGCFVLGVTSAAAGQIAIRLVWRVHVVASWRERRRTRANRASNGDPMISEAPPSKGQETDP